eukprot:139197-Amphidinium_carterae.1
MTTNRQRDKSTPENIEIPQVDTTMNKRLHKRRRTLAKHSLINTSQKQDSHKSNLESGHRIWVNNKEVQQPPDLEQAGAQQGEQLTLEQDTIQPPQGLEQQATYTYIHPTPNALAKQDNYKPPH